MEFRIKINLGDVIEEGERILWRWCQHCCPYSLNHAAVTPVSKRAAETISLCIGDYCRNGIVCNKYFLESVEGARTLAAQLVGASPDEIAFVKNTTQGLLIAADGINWKKGDNILIPEKEFPANVYPWLKLSKDGVELRFVPLKNGRYTAADIDTHFDRRTKAVSVYSNPKG